MARIKVRDDVFQRQKYLDLVSRSMRESPASLYSDCITDERLGKRAFGIGRGSKAVLGQGCISALLLEPVEIWGIAV